MEDWKHGCNKTHISTSLRAFIYKEAAPSGMVVTSTPFLNSTLFCVLFDSSATHSSISTWSSLQLDPKHVKIESNYIIKLSNDYIVDCPILYKLVPISIDDFIIPRDLIYFDPSYFNIILEWTGYVLEKCNVYMGNIDRLGLKFGINLH